MTFDGVGRLLFGGLGLILCLALPTQMAIELVGWLQSAEWANYDTIWLLGEEVARDYYSTDMKGLNFIVHWTMDIWVSIPVALVGLGVFNAAMA